MTHSFRDSPRALARMSDRSRNVSEKSEAALRTIGEVAEDLDLPQHVLRFWETKFREIEPVKRAGGRRYYRPRDVELLAAIRHLLYGEGYTIKGVQRMLKEQGARSVVEGAAAGARSAAAELPFAEFGLESAGKREPDKDPLAPGPRAVEPSFFPSAHGSDEAECEVQSRLSDESLDGLTRALNQIAECKRLLGLTRR
jgi:DNA-binding transcriptional MerR regulator